MPAAFRQNPNMNYKVEGMDCASCAATIKTALSGLPGVEGVTVSVARERMSLYLDPNKTAQDKLEKIVKKLGFTAVHLPGAANERGPVQDHADSHGHDHGAGCDGHHHDHAAEAPARIGENTQMFRIEGMECASCAATITKALVNLPGVASPNVSVAREMLTLDLDQAQTSTGDVEKLVKRLGFQPTHLSGGAEAQSTAAAPENRAAWWQAPKVRHLLVSLALTVAAFAGSFAAPDLTQVLFTAVTVFAIWPIARRAVVAAQLGAVFTIQMLMTIAATGAVIIGEQEEALFVVLLFMVGEFLEGLAADKARSGIKALGKLLPQEALVDDNGTLHPVAADSLRLGQIIVSRPGDRIAADGEIVDGMSSVDESPVTGESIPVSKRPGERVFAGTVNHDAALRVRVDRAPEDNTIARIITMVEEAQDSKAPTERFIESFSKIYMPIILVFAAAVVVIPPLLGLGTWDTWIYRGLALLLIGCPCALVISVPAAIASSLSAGARHGLLIKGGAVIEEIARTTRVVFDKTGTLTEGKPHVTDLHPVTGDEVAFLALAAGIERESSHPLAEAITRAANDRGIKPAQADNVRIVPGKGMEGTVDRAPVFIGAPRFASEKAPITDALKQRIEMLEDNGKTVAVVIESNAVLGLIAMRDEPREDARTGLADLKKTGIGALMMTGDNARTGAAIGKDLGIEVMAEMLPETKAARVRELVETETVVMVGDGVNDAPALAEASVGVAIGSGTDVAMEAADAALMRNTIGDVSKLVKLARATMNNIRQNVAIALGLKAVFLVTTVTGISGLWMAVMADTGATVLVTLNAMRLLGHLGKHS